MPKLVCPKVFFGERFQRIVREACRTLEIGVSQGHGKLRQSSSGRGNRASSDFRIASRSSGTSRRTAPGNPMGWGVILPLGKCLVALEKSLGGPPVNRALSGGSKKREFSMLFESAKFLAGLFFLGDTKGLGHGLGRLAKFPCSTLGPGSMGEIHRTGTSFLRGVESYFLAISEFSS
jgi:hypothetical protein